MVLLERVRLLTQGHNHDDPTRRLLNTCTHLGKLRTAGHRQARVLMAPSATWATHSRSRGTPVLRLVLREHHHLMNPNKTQYGP